MPLTLQQECTITGPALPEPFVKLNLEAELVRLRLLPPTTGEDAQTLLTWWSTFRNHLRLLVSQGGPRRVQNQVIEPLLDCPGLGYRRIEAADEVQTREGTEDGGDFLVSESGDRLRFWTVGLDEDLDAPARRGEAYRFSVTKIASRVLLNQGERLGLLTNGTELRLLICDPARTDSAIAIAVDPSWKRSREIPDSFRLFFALTSPAGVRALPELIEKARLQQAKVTKDLRLQARLAVEQFLQAILDHPENQAALTTFPDKTDLARRLWREGLITVYRLLFVLKLEATDDPAKCFSFASGSLWRNTFSPGVALAPLVRTLLDRGTPTGSLLEDGLRVLFRMLAEGLQCTELNVRPMAGSLFALTSTPILSSLRWSEEGVARLLDHLLWTTVRRGALTRERVHYGPLDVEDLGRVYEALLELDPGISTAPMCRLRRAKLEVVVPSAQGHRYRPQDNSSVLPVRSDDQDEAPTDEGAPDEESETPSKKTKVEWIEEIPPGRFFLRVGLGRKSTGSFYTPHSFVRFLVLETLGPLVERVSSREDPRPAAILALKVVDKAMGSGHFLVEACRFLGEALYEACRRCDDLAAQATVSAETYCVSRHEDQTAIQEARAADFLARVEALPDPDDELLRYLPSRAPEGAVTGYSQARAISLCRRMVAVHCLYGVDKNPLAVELAKLALWIECHAEGLPLTFLDHRLVTGDSLTGPFFEHLLKYPGTQTPLDDLFTDGLKTALTVALTQALQHIRELEKTVGLSEADIQNKQAAKVRLDRALAPFKLLAAAWSGGVMLGGNACDDTGYATLARTVAETGDLPTTLDESASALRAMLATGLGLTDFPPCASCDEILAQLNSPDCLPAFSYDLGFPEVFFPTGDPNARRGFDADLGNPPWEGIDASNKEFFAAFDFSIFDLTGDREIKDLIDRLLAQPQIATAHEAYAAGIARIRNALRLYRFCNQDAERESEATPDLYQGFTERAYQTLADDGRLGMVLPSSIHSNKGATGMRRLLLDEMKLLCCYSFENRRELFEIHRSYKFALICAERIGPTKEFECAFYLQELEWLFREDKGDTLLNYTPEFLLQTSGELRNFLELRSGSTVPIAHAMYRNKAGTFGTVRTAWAIFPTEELHTSKQKHRTRPLAELLPILSGDTRLPEALTQLNNTAALLVCKGEHFHHFNSLWGDAPTVGATLQAMEGKEQRVRASRYFRMVFRRQARSTDERTVISFLSPPGILYFDSALPERDPHARPNSRALILVALANSYAFDWLTRQLVSANVTFNFLDTVPVPQLSSTMAFLAHSALRLTCNHAGYELLWRDQSGDAWRESRTAFAWPVLAGDDARWAVRAAIDAVVATAYGLTRDQYAHVLSTFSHTSYKSAPRLCLSAFDELHSLGIEAFTKKHDPYHDIPLNDLLPTPVIELPVADKNPQPVVISLPGRSLGTTELGFEIEELPPWTKVSETDRHVALLAKIIVLHQGTPRESTLGSVKAEKIAHLFEARYKASLGRDPVRLAAGPVDFTHLKRVVHRAGMKFAFKFTDRESGYGHEFTPLGGLQKASRGFDTMFAPCLADMEAFLAMFVPMKTEDAEARATLYAVWNDLLASGQQPKDSDLIAGFYRWHPDKKKFRQTDLTDALTWLRTNELVPDGTAKLTAIAPKKSKSKRAPSAPNEPSHGDRTKKRP